MSARSIAGKARRFAGRQGRAWAFNTGSVLLLLLFWQLIVVCTGVNSALFPSPLQTWNAFLEILNDGTLADHIASSMYRFAVGFFVSVLTAVVLGLVFGWIDWMFRLVNPVLQILRPISPIAWMPFIVLAFGIGDVPAIVIIFLAGFFPVFLSTVAGVRNIPNIYFRVSASFGVGPVEIFWKVIFPEIVPAALTGFGLAFGRCLGEYGSVVFIAGNKPFETEIAPLIIMSELQEYDYASATTIALVMLIASFVTLFLVNLIQTRNTRILKGGA